MQKNSYISHFFILVFFLMALSCCVLDTFQARTLFDFEKESELDYLRWKCGIMMERDRRHATSGQYSLRVEMYNNDEYPGFNARIEESWVGAGKLLVDIHNPALSEISLLYRIDDREDTPDYADRANGRLLVLPGDNTLSLDLANMHTSGTDRLLDLHRIRSLLFFVQRPEKKITLYLDNIRLLR